MLNKIQSIFLVMKSLILRLYFRLFENLLKKVVKTKFSLFVFLPDSVPRSQTMLKTSVPKFHCGPGRAQIGNLKSEFKDTARPRLDLLTQGLIGL